MDERATEVGTCQESVEWRVYRKDVRSASRYGSCSSWHGQITECLNTARLFLCSYDDSAQRSRQIPGRSSYTAGMWTHDLLIASPTLYRWATAPPNGRHGDPLSQNVVDRSSPNFLNRYTYRQLGMINLTFFLRLLKGRCYVTDFLVRMGENWRTPPLFCALAFHNGWEDSNMDACVNTPSVSSPVAAALTELLAAVRVHARRASTSCKNLVNWFSNPWVLLARLHWTSYTLGWFWFNRIRQMAPIVDADARSSVSAAATGELTLGFARHLVASVTGQMDRPSCRMTVVLSQCRSGSDGRSDRHRLHAGTHQTREDAGRLRSRDLPALAAQLHGADRGPVRVHARRARRGDPVGRHRGPGAQSLRTSTATQRHRRQLFVHRHWTRVQGPRSSTVVHCSTSLGWRSREFRLGLSWPTLSGTDVYPHMPILRPHAAQTC